MIGNLAMLGSVLVPWMMSITLGFTQFSATDKKVIPVTTQGKQPPKCSFDPASSELFFSEDLSQSKLLVFTSFSSPLETWLEHSYDLERLKGAFILRGLPNNSFELLQTKIIELRKAGVKAEILLDPEAFEKYAITAVPAIVLTQDAYYDKLLGNVRIPYALSLFSEMGETQEQALQLLKQAGAY